MAYSTTSATSSYTWYSIPSTPLQRLKEAEVKLKKEAKRQEEPKEQIFLFDSKDLDI